MSTSSFKKALGLFDKANPNLAGNIARKALPESSTVRQLTDPTGSALASNGSLRSGDLTDPAGLFHKLGSDTAGQVAAPPELPNLTQTGVSARDRTRRQVYRAHGRSSTIRVPALASAYTGQQQMLLGS